VRRLKNEPALEIDGRTKSRAMTGA
jgi:hypothetical protein